MVGKLLVYFCCIIQINFPERVNGNLTDKTIAIEFRSNETLGKDQRFIGLGTNFDSNRFTKRDYFSSMNLYGRVDSVVNDQNYTGTRKSLSNQTTAYPVLTTLSKPPAQGYQRVTGTKALTCRKLYWLLFGAWQVFSNDSVTTLYESARHKNYYQKSFPIIIIAFMMMLAFVIPMGFQFMVMVGGKALLLSQMALIFGLSGAFKKWNMPDFTTYEYPWNRVANEPSANRFDNNIPLRKTTNYQTESHQDLYKLPFF